MYDDGEEGLFGLDLGVASCVIALWAAGRIPFSSCNGGAFGDMHHERNPLVAFFAMRAWLPVLMTMAEEANVGLINSGDGLGRLRRNSKHAWVRKSCYGPEAGSFEH